MRPAPLAEFITIAAAMISMVAISIDAMLPALPDIGNSFALTDRNDQQLVITSLFLGLGIGQLIYGPMSDATGRKPAIYTGFTLFFVGTSICLFAANFKLMLVGRFLQGLGAASPRIVMMAIIRDRFEGVTMAQVMSFIMAVFILVPALAPLMGQGILLIGSWQLIFVVFLLYGLVILSWFTLRQPETLPLERRQALNPREFVNGIKFIARQKLSVGAILVMGMVFGGFVGYLGSAQQIFVDYYHTGTTFPLYFAMLALLIGCASIANSKLVVRFGVPAVSLSALIAQSILSAIMLLLFVFVFQNHPPFWMFLLYCFPLFFFLGLQFGNLNALAMKPLGHIAGLGASVCGALPTTLAVPVGTLVGQSYNGTPIPLTTAFLIFGILGSLIFYKLCREPA